MGYETAWDQARWVRSRGRVMISVRIRVRNRCRARARARGSCRGRGKGRVTGMISSNKHDDLRLILAVTLSGGNKQVTLTGEIADKATIPSLVALPSFVMALPLFAMALI